MLVAWHISDIRADLPVALGSNLGSAENSVIFEIFTILPLASLLTDDQG